MSRLVDGCIARMLDTAAEGEWWEGGSVGASEGGGEGSVRSEEEEEEGGLAGWREDDLEVD